MFEDLAKRLAESLTRGDIFELFKTLEHCYGTISKACESVGIERRTFYNWRSAREINLETKIKVLKVALEKYPIDTLEFLARKSRDKTREVLALIMEILRREILYGEDSEVPYIIKRYENIIKEFSIPITEYLHQEVSNLVEAAYSREYEVIMRPRVVTGPFHISTSLSLPMGDETKPQFISEAQGFITSATRSSLHQQDREQQPMIKTLQISRF
jgi:hypothetical protein